MTIGDRIRELRINKGMSLRELGAMVGVTAATLQRYENGVISNIRPDMVHHLADALGTSVGWLMGEKADQPRGTKAVELSQSEEMLLRIYRTIPEDERDIIRQTLLILNRLHFRLYEAENALDYAEAFIRSTEYASDYEKEKESIQKEP